MCYHVKFGSSVTIGVRINRKEPKIGERLDPAPLGWGVADQWPIKNKLPPHVLTTSNW